MRLPKVKVKAEHTSFIGGLDLESPAMAIDPGSLLAGYNYMAKDTGGYSRIDGYERYDGQDSPSDATYYYCACTFLNGGPSVGDEIEGLDSGSTGEVIAVGAAYINITKRSAALNADEIYKVGATNKGTFTAAQQEKGETTSLLHATAMNAAADVYRADIAEPTSSGAVRGLVLLDGTLYCFIDNQGSTAGMIYKESAAGWEAITLLNEISFDTGSGTISEGDTITGGTSGATAVVSRVVLEGGAWEANASGRLIIGTVTGGPFQAEDLEVTGKEAEATGAESAITIIKGGRYDFVVYNFTGETATKRIYGCDGVNRGFEFDGTTYVPIETGMTVDTPTHVAAYKHQLFFSFKGSSQNSGIGFPYTWSLLTGADEIGLGDDITGYAVEAKGLLIYSRNSTHQLLGASGLFELDEVSDETGGVEWTVQKVGKPYCMDDRGIVETARVQEYGNFNIATLSRKIQTPIDAMRAVVVASSVYRTLNQYRLYGSDGTGICMTISQGQYGPVYQFTQFEYPDSVACTVSGEDSTGKDVVFFGDDAGMVYQADKGSSYDGDDIESFLSTSFNHLKSPTTLKTFRRAVIEMVGSAYVNLKCNAILSYGDTTIQSHSLADIDIPITGTGALWDLTD